MANKRSRKAGSASSTSQAKSGAGGIQGASLRNLKRKNEALSKENASLRARVDELALKARKYDVLRLAQNRSRASQRRLQEQHRELAAGLDEGEGADDRLRGALAARAEGRLRMCESYQGEVVDVYGDRVVVVYDVSGDVVEQTYERGQFLEERLPVVGTELVVYIIVAEIEPRVAESVSEEDERGDEVSGPRRKPLSEPTTF